MTRQVDLLYMKHNTSFRSQVALTATQNSKGAGAIYRMIYEMFYFKNGTFQSTFELNRFKNYLACSFSIYLRCKSTFTRIQEGDQNMLSTRVKNSKSKVSINSCHTCKIFYFEKSMRSLTFLTVQLATADFERARCIEMAPYLASMPVMPAARSCRGRQNK